MKNLELARVTSRRHQVLVRLDEETIEAIRRHPRYREALPGREGGVPRWIRESVHEMLGMPIPADTHEAQSAERRGQPRRRPSQ